LRSATQARADRSPRGHSVTGLSFSGISWPKTDFEYDVAGMKGFPRNPVKSGIAEPGHDRPARGHFNSPPGKITEKESQPRAL
jgi:hypothetical protein